MSHGPLKMLGVIPDQPAIDQHLFGRAGYGTLDPPHALGTPSEFANGGRGARCGVARLRPLLRPIHVQSTCELTGAYWAQLCWHRALAPAGVVERRCKKMI